MSTLIRIELPIEDGKHMLTKEAIKILQKATYMRFEFRSNRGVVSEGSCRLTVSVKDTESKNPEAEIWYQMPVNVNLKNIDPSEANWEICYREKMPKHHFDHYHFQKSIPWDSKYIEFTPEFDAGSHQLREHGKYLHLIYFYVETRQSCRKGIFAQEMANRFGGMITKRPLTVNSNPVY